MHQSSAPVGWGETHTEETHEQELRLESPSRLSAGPFLGSCSSQAKAKKENRGRNSSRLPYKLRAFPAGVRLCLGWAPSTYLAAISVTHLQVLLKSPHGQAEQEQPWRRHGSSGHEKPWTSFPDLPLTLDMTLDVVPQFPKR